MAQFGRALRSGRRGRRFKSCRFDPYLKEVSDLPKPLFLLRLPPKMKVLNFGLAKIKLNDTIKFVTVIEKGA